MNALNRARKLRERGVEPFAFRIIKTGPVTNYDFNEGAIAVRAYEAKKAMARIRMGIQNRGASAGGTIERGHTGRIMEAHVQPSKMRLEDYSLRGLRTIRRRMFEAARETVQSRAQRYYDNYMRALDTVGADYLMPEAYAEIRSILWELRLKAPRDLPRVFDEADDEVRIDFVYDDAIEAAERFAYILDAWRDVRQDLVDKGRLKDE